MQNSIRLWPGLLYLRAEVCKSGNRRTYLRYIEISGGKSLGGSITVQGSKNAVLPILTSCLMGEGICQIENCPRISDVNVTLRLLEAAGCKVIREGNTVWVDAADVCRSRIPSEEASHIRSSVLFLGAFLGKCRKASLPLPGGCAIGARPVDLHIRALEALGVRFEDKGELSADGAALHGGRISLPYPSVGATENSILAAVLAPGMTKIAGAAREPEIGELCRFLNLRGAKILCDGKGNILIHGVRQLRPVCYRIQADRIVAGTYLIAAAAAGGEIRINNFPQSGMEAPIKLLCECGAEISQEGDTLRMDCCRRPQAVSYLETAPYPGFPTDLQSPLLALLAGAQGRSCIRETVFENRFCVVKELQKMGADIQVKEDRVFVNGRADLTGAWVNTPDLRSGAALVTAGLCASGLTRISHIEYIERGYEDICRDLRQLGADISLIEEA